jgi:hypothetical protein
MGEVYRARHQADGTVKTLDFALAEAMEPPGTLRRVA